MQGQSDVYGGKLEVMKISEKIEVRCWRALNVESVSKRYISD